MKIMQKFVKVPTLCENVVFYVVPQLELAYNMPRKLMDKWKLQNVKLFVRANNPFLITNFKVWDVELGEDGFNYPIQKTYAIGLNFSF